MHDTILDITIGVVFLGGLVGFIMAPIKLFGGTPGEYGVLGIGGGLRLISCAIAILIRGKLA
jgi:hypothetical protein